MEIRLPRTWHRRVPTLGGGEPQALAGSGGNVYRAFSHSAVAGYHRAGTSNFLRGRTANRSRIRPLGRAQSDVSAPGRIRRGGGYNFFPNAADQTKLRPRRSFGKKKTDPFGLPPPFR